MLLSIQHTFSNETGSMGTKQYSGDRPSHQYLLDEWFGREKTNFVCFMIRLTVYKRNIILFVLKKIMP